MQLCNAGQVRRGKIRITPEWQRLIEMLKVGHPRLRCTGSGKRRKFPGTGPGYVLPVSGALRSKASNSRLLCLSLDLQGNEYLFHRVKMKLADPHTVLAYG